jgi:hypothetical protein
MFGYYLLVLVVNMGMHDHKNIYFSIVHETYILFFN